MATFFTTPEGAEGGYQITFVNHSNTEINYDLRTVSGDPTNFGTVAPGATAQSHTWNNSNFLEHGNIAVVGIGHFGQPQLVPAPGVRFWSGYVPVQKVQYINLLAGNSWRVTRNTSELSEVTSNGFRVTVDGGGQPNPTTDNIVFQVYNA
jgi:hypothetical protein